MTWECALNRHKECPKEERDLCTCDCHPTGDEYYEEEES